MDAVLYITNRNDKLLTMLEINSFFEDQTNHFKQTLIANIQDRLNEK